MTAMDATDEECWEYLDPKAVKRGPFTRAMMIAWFERNFLPEDLSVRHSPLMPYVPIKELFHPPLLPFRSRPWPGQATKCAASWEYSDTKGLLQGPFSSPQMALWHKEGMLPATLRLRIVGENAFALTSDYFPPPLVPFVSPPRRLADPPKQAAKEPPGPPPPSMPAPLAALFAAASKAPQGNGSSLARPHAEAVTAEAGSKNGGEKGKGREIPTSSPQPSPRPDTASWSWSEAGWAPNDKAHNWWEWNAWNDWSESGKSTENWDRDPKDKAQGTEWKGKGGQNNSPTKERGDKTAVQAAFGPLAWGPHADLADLFPEEPIRKVIDEGIVWEERWISPLAVRFSQGKIHPFFHERGPILEVMSQIKLKETAEGNGALRRRIDPPFPPVRLLHLKEQGALVTLDNRRLYALQRFALQEWPEVCLTKALVVSELPPMRLKAENRKFTNRLCGLQLEVESRQNAFDTFSWVTEAAHVEAGRFARPVAFRAQDRTVSLFPVLIVSMLLCPQAPIRKLLASRWPLLKLLASVLRNPQRRAFPSRRLLFHHILELSKPSHEGRVWPPLCVAFHSETVVALSKGKSCVTSKLSLTRPLTLLKVKSPMSQLQGRVLLALFPLFCLPYARALRQEWLIGFLLAWGKVAVAMLRLP